MPSPHLDPQSSDCRAVTSVLARVGDKWTVLIVALLGDGPKRFNEIKRHGRRHLAAHADADAARLWSATAWSPARSSRPCRRGSTTS